MFSISRKNGEATLSIPKNSPDKDTLLHSANCAFLLPRNCKNVSGEEFAKVILDHNDSDQARAVADALRRAS